VGPKLADEFCGRRYPRLIRIVRGGGKVGQWSGAMKALRAE
jgi:hypothetical protein